MKTIQYNTLKEILYYQTCDNGLKVFLLPKKGFSKTYGLLSTRFGSIDTSFVPLGEEKMITVPDGVAHFLEHKMFDMDGTDASDEFAKLGASTNAFTSSSRTAYLFSTTTNELSCVDLLLDFVERLDVTDESVEKEKGIINQEIGMYDDDPDWRCYFGSITNLYHEHPVRIDIAGTVETVSTIDKHILEKCYQTFYHPSNMMLFVVGNINPEKTMKRIVENQDKKSFETAKPIQRKVIKEDKSVFKKEEILKMDVTMPKLIVSMKINDILDDPKKKIKRELSSIILFDLLFSKSSQLREEWTKEKIINDTFSANMTQERDYSFIQFGGDTDFVDELRNHIHLLIKELKNYQFDQSDFERTKKKNIGMMINSFNSPEAIANLFSRYYFEGTMSFDLIDIYSSLTLDDIYDLITLFDDELTSDFIILPK